MCKGCLSDEGVLAVQSTSPYYATDAFWCINKTIADEGLFVKAYHLEVPAFGDWGFNMASRRELSENIKSLLGVAAKVRLVSPKSIKRSEGKAIRVIDNRKLH